MSNKIIKNKPVINTGMTLYDLNKQLIANEQPFDAIFLNKKVKNMVSDIMERKKQYWMLLCNERKDYTVFIPITLEGTVKELIETLLNRGQIVSIEKQEDNNYEIWIRDPDTQENFAYYFFDYTFGVIKA